MSDPPGIVDPQKLYRLDSLSRISGVGKAGLRQMRSKGLQVRYSGRCGWVLGQDFIEFIVATGKLSRQTEDATSST